MQFVAVNEQFKQLLLHSVSRMRTLRHQELSLLSHIKGDAEVPVPRTSRPTFFKQSAAAVQVKVSMSSTAVLAWSGLQLVQFVAALVHSWQFGSQASQVDVFVRKNVDGHDVQFDDVAPEQVVQDSSHALMQI